MSNPVSRRRLLVGSLTLAGVAATPPVARAALAGAASHVNPAAPAAVPPEELPWPEARAIVAATKLPTFPAATFNVLSYGAKADNATDNTDAFARAINACNAAGGGTVIVPTGTYVTGAIYLKSNVNLRLDGATLMFSGDATKYPTVFTRYEAIECMNHSPMIYAYGEHNIALTGTGTLDAKNTATWNKGHNRAFLENMIANGVTDPRKRIVPGSGTSLLVAFIEPYRCDTVLIQGISVRNTQFWQLHPTLSTNVTVDSVNTSGVGVPYSTDGCDPECCDHVVIKNSTLGSNDDAIAIKAGRDDDARRVNVPCQNIVIFGCTLNGTVGGIACGSEQTSGIRNVYAYKNTMGAATQFALYVKSNTRRGGFTTNVNVDNLSGSVTGAYVLMTTTYQGQTGPYLPAFSNFTITNSSCTHASRVLDLNGLSNAHINGITLLDCNFNGVANPTNILNNVDNVSLTNVRINGAPVGGSTSTVYEAELLTFTSSGPAAVDTEAGASNGQLVKLNATANGGYLEFTLPNVPAGTYNVKVTYKSINTRGLVQATIGGVNLGGLVDQYRSTITYGLVADLGSTTFAATGNKLIRFTVNGKNASSLGYTASVDSIILTPVP
jgi:polygalacturonase